MSGERSDEVVNDSRFKHMHSDPRFQRMPRKKTELEVDPRFQRMFEDEEFQTGSNTGVDKYGRPVQKETLKDFYDMDQEGEESEVSSVESSSEEDESEDESVENIVEYGIAEDEVTLGDETNRVALVNLDWSRIRAIDILVVLNSFLPEGGVLNRVVVYQSDFGAEHMITENSSGPSGLWDGEASDEEVDLDTLRRYESNRLRYFYAVAEFDSVATASHVCEECDGLEFESSGSMLDCRFVPEGQSFEGRVIRDQVNKGDESGILTYKAPEFTVKALQHSKVELTWDKDDCQREAVFKAQRAPKETTAVQQTDFDAYLASDGDDDGYGTDAPVEAEGVILKRRARTRYAELLGDLAAEEEEETETMEIVFQSGLKSIGKEVLKRREERELANTGTVWEQTMRKKKLAKANRNTEVVEEGVDEELLAAVADDSFFADAFGEEFAAAEGKSTVKSNKKSKKGKKQREPEVELDPAAKADLEMLVSEDLDRGFDLSKLEKGEDDGFRVDVEDGRFNAVFEHEDFAIDPTDPAFKKTEAMGELLQERQKRRLQNRELEEKEVARLRKVRKSNQVFETKTNRPDVSAVIAKLKKKQRKQSRK